MKKYIVALFLFPVAAGIPAGFALANQATQAPGGPQDTAFASQSKLVAPFEQAFAPEAVTPDSFREYSSKNAPAWFSQVFGDRFSEQWVAQAVVAIGMLLMLYELYSGLKKSRKKKVEEINFTRSVFLKNLTVRSAGDEPMSAAMRPKV